MSCNCKANKEIMKIYKNYGYKINTSWMQKFNFNLKENIKVIFIFLLLILLFPIIFIIIIIFAFKNKNNININKLLKKFFKKNE